jgi:hypothetical protein
MNSPQWSAAELWDIDNKDRFKPHWAIQCIPKKDGVAPEVLTEMSGF